MVAQQTRADNAIAYLRYWVGPTKSSWSSSSPSSSELRREPGVDLEGKKPPPWAGAEGGEASCVFERPLRGVDKPVMLDMLKRLGRESEVGKPLFVLLLLLLLLLLFVLLYSGGVVGWLCLPYLISVER